MKTAYQDMWYATKVVCGEIFLAVNPCIKKEEKSKIKDGSLSFFCKKLDTEEQIKCEGEERK